MKNILTILFLLPALAFAQPKWNAATGNTDFKDSIKFSKYRNGDTSAIGIDANGKLMRLAAIPLNITGTNGITVTGTSTDKTIGLTDTLQEGPGISITKTGGRVIISGSAAGNSLVSAPNPDLTDSTVTVVPNVIYWMNGVKDTIPDSESWVINSVPDGQKQSILIYINSSGALDTAQGQIGTLKVNPPVPPGGIAVSYVDVYGSEIQPPLTVSGYQRTGFQYINSEGASATDSAYASYDDVTKTASFFKLKLNGVDRVSSADSALTLVNGEIKYGAVTGGGGGATTFEQSIINGNTLTQNRTVNQATKTMSFSNGKVGIDSLLLNHVAVWNTPDSLLGFGDSYGVGTGASVIDSAYLNRLKTYYGLPLSNYAVGGAGATGTALNHYANTYPGHKHLSVVMTGFNDVYRSQANRKTQNKIINGLSSVFASQFMKSYQPAGTGANVTRYGTWSDYTANAVGGKSSAGKQTSNVNDSIVYTFTDTTLIVAMMGSDGVTNTYSNSVEIYLDNVLVKTVNTNTQTNGVTDGAIAPNTNPGTITPLPFFFTGLTNTSHKVKLVNKNANPMVVDYFGHFVDKSEAIPMLLFKIQRMAVTILASNPGGSTLADLDTLNAKIDSLVTNWPVGYPVFLAQTGNYFTAIPAQMSSDSIHPNNVGYRALYNAGIAALSSINDNSVSDNVLYNDERLYFVDGHIHNKLAYVSEIPNSWNKGGNNVLAAETSSIGTTNNRALRIITRDSTRMIVDSTGSRLGIGLTNPQYNIDAYESIRALASTSGVALWVGSSAAIRGDAASNGTMYIDASRNTTGTISIRSTTTNVSGALNAQSTATVAQSLDVQGSTSTNGYMLNGVSVATSTTGDSLLRINDNSRYKRIGIRGDKYQFNDDGTGAASWTWNQSALVEMRSTTKGLLIPKMTTTNRNAIGSPATGLLVYNTSVDSFQYYAGSWKNLGGSTIDTAAMLSAYKTRLDKISSGTYQPTITSIANLDAISISRCIYERVDSACTIAGEITLDPTSASGTLARARFTFPFTTDLNASWQCDGIIYTGIAASTAIGGAITADQVNDQAEINFPANFTSSQTAKFKLTFYIR